MSSDLPVECSPKSANLLYRSADAPLLPREKLEKWGAASMTNEELLALILGSGNHECSVFELSRRLSDFLSIQTQVPPLEKLRRIRGLGRVKASQVLACLELSGRYILGNSSCPVMSPEDILPRLSFLKYEVQEHLVVVTLTAANGVIGIHEITTGLVNQTPVHPREAFVKAIEDHAVSVVFAHNHPSGSIEPSAEDMGVTRLLCASGRILRIPVLDHIIVGKGGFTSFCRMYPEMFERTFEPA